jgi:hypothetical protein
MKKPRALFGIKKFPFEKIFVEREGGRINNHLHFTKLILHAAQKLRQHIPPHGGKGWNGHENASRLIK